MNTKLKVLIFTSLIVFTNKLNAQNLEWVNQMGNTTFDAGNSITVDDLGNVYTTGQFSGTVDFDPSINTSYLTSVGQKDIFIQKTDANGNFIWAKSMGGGSQDYANTTVDALGNVFTAGYFYGTVEFDPGAGISNLTSVWGSDGFVQKLDANGNFIWVKQIGGSLIDFINSITLDNSGNIYLTGSFEGTADFDPDTASTYNLTSAGNKDIFVEKLDPNGNFVWAKRMGSSSQDQGIDLDVDSSGNVYSTGMFYGTIDFDPGAGFNNLTATSRDVYVQKLDNNGNFLWAKNMGGLGATYVFSLAIDSFGNVHITGGFQYTVDFDPSTNTSNLTTFGSYDIFVQKMDGNGNFLWVKQLGGTSTDEGLSIALDPLGNIYTTGMFYQTADFDPDTSSTINLTSTGDYDIFIVKLDANGNFLWVKQMGGALNDYGVSLVVDDLGNILTTGRFEGTSDFDPGVGISNLTSLGDYDIFVQKLGTITVNVEKNESNNSFSIYPNPTYDNFFINLGNLYSIVEISIYDINGKIIKSESFKEKQIVHMSVEEPEGIYLVTIKIDSELTTIKLVKN